MPRLPSAKLSASFHGTDSKVPGIPTSYEKVALFHTAPQEESAPEMQWGWGNFCFRVYISIATDEECCKTLSSLVCLLRGRNVIGGWAIKFLGTVIFAGIFFILFCSG